MNKKFHHIHIFYKRCRLVFFLFCLDLFFLILSTITGLLPIRHSKLYTFILLQITIFIFIHAALLSLKSIIQVSRLEDYFLNKRYGSTASLVHSFHKIIEGNLFEYHFQPIISAKTGEIIAYEALMRTDVDKVSLMPVEILDLAAKENSLYDIEKYTFFNTLKIMKEHSEVFKTKKLFINSILSHPLTDEDFQKLLSEYSDLFPNIVVEITDMTQFHDENLKLLITRIKETNCQLALDDYGNGYYNTSNLLNSIPDYVKINRTLLRHINIDSNKQQLVINLINFAAQNNIKIIAEGVESYEEFEYVINLGVDYIQGFYSAKPEPSPVNTMSEDLLHKIQNIHCMQYSFNSGIRIYESKEDSILSPVTLALKMYSDIIIYENDITLLGNQDMVANISLVIPDNHNCNLTLNNVNLHGFEKPAITIGKNCSVVINLIGDNFLTYDGIRVPETSDLIIAGDGNLTVQAAQAKRVGIGGTFEQAYGNITLASTGNIRINKTGHIAIGIGGGFNPENSLIELKSGNLIVETRGSTSVSIGSIFGNVRIKIGNCSLKSYSEAVNAVSIGCIKGYADILISGNLDIKSEGKFTVSIGVLEESEGNITILDGITNIHYNSYNGTAIGSLGGNIDINILDGEISAFGEGTDILGIGNLNGFGKIYILYGVIATRLIAAKAIPICNLQRNVIIDGGNIQCDFPEDITPVNSYGTPLVAHIVTASDEFRQTIETVSYTYEYKATYSHRYPYIKVYLPENTILSNE